jgi:hypothetical protein
MQLVHGEHAFDGKDLGPNVLQRDLPWYSLKEDKGCATDQWKGRVEDDGGDDQTDYGITIVLETPGRKPNNKPGRNNSDIA